eukprot:m.94934 g.94934  ORF g.94934 m.94934 type:complete len:525 (+) comp26770_c0_seq1:261-1835(+)
MEVKEILTIQVGNFANRVGAHYWNHQTNSFCYDPEQSPPDVFHDALFRPGSTVHGKVTYLPRAIFFDLNHAADSVKQEQGDGDLESKRQNVVTWQGNVQTIDLRDSEPPSSALPMEVSTQDNLVGAIEDMLPWSDVLNSRLHLNTLCVVRQHSQLDDPPTFEKFMSGEAFFSPRPPRDDFDDKVHFFLEECDHIQGIQTMIDLHDGFAGLGTSIVSALRDDHGKIPIYCFGLAPPIALRRAPGADIINQALGIVALQQDATMLIPTSTTEWDGRVITTNTSQTTSPTPPPTPAQSVEDSAAWIADVLDNATLGYRLKNDGHSMGSVAAMLTGTNNGCYNFAVAAGARSFFTTQPGLGQDPTFSQMLNTLALVPLHSTSRLKYLAPAYTPTTASALYCTLRGIDAKSLRPTSEDLLLKELPSNEFDRCTSAREMFSRYIGKTKSSHNFFVAESSVKAVVEKGREQQTTGGVGAFLADENTRNIVVDLKQRLSKVERMVQQKFSDGGFSRDDYIETLESLEVLAQK